MKSKIFISYRRQDSKKSAALLHTKLRSKFKTFYDKEDIDLGTNWIGVKGLRRNWPSLKWF